MDRSLRIAAKLTSQCSNVTTDLTIVLYLDVSQQRGNVASNLTTRLHDYVAVHGEYVPGDVPAYMNGTIQAGQVAGFIAGLHPDVAISLQAV